MSLIEKVREIQAFLKKEHQSVKDLAKFISDGIGCNTYVLNTMGDIVGLALPGGSDCTKTDEKNPSLKQEFKQRIGFIFQTTANLPVESCLFTNENCVHPDTYMSILPIPAKRAGHLLLTKRGRQFSDDELVLAEVAALVSGIFLLEFEANEIAENGVPMSGGNIQLVLDSLSFSELKAISNVFKDLNGTEGFLVASKIADRIGISRSVIVNAMRKLESAGVVDSRSLGIKGTYIKIKNSNFLDALKTRVNG